MVGQDEDGSSEARYLFWYLGVRRTRCLIIFPKSKSRTTKMCSSNYDTDTRRYRQVFIVFHRLARKTVNSEISDAIYT